jgi:cytochrome c oxidase accessory protein FixG
MPTSPAQPLAPASEPAASTRSSAPVAPSVLSTLNDDGSRRWLRPRVSPGRFLTARRLVAYALIAIFALIPIIHIHGKPIVLLDIIGRQFHIFGATFYPTDTLLLALLMVSLFILVFWVTALFGRIWCGWACPQTVYMEFVYRPIERLFEGAPGHPRKGWLQTSPMRKPLKLLAYLACSLALAHTFLAYFVSWDNLSQWVFGAPGTHIIGFGVVAFITGAMMFNFGYFREQTCLVACPYGRFQSVMLDRHSLIIRYDQKRGEPRGAKRSAAREVPLPVLAGAGAPALGDCIDCRMCVTTCPTGIDIRNGLQMECVGCAQCIDACDSIMDKIGRARGLIRYSSEAAARGERFRVLRPRVVVYPAVLLVLVALFTVVLLNTGVADVTILRGLGQPFTVSAEHGGVMNPVRIKLVNRLDHAADFTISAEVGANAAPLQLDIDSPTVRIPAGQMMTVPAQIIAPPNAFHDGRLPAIVTISGPEKYTAKRPFMLLGPRSTEEHGEPGEHKEGHP